LPFCGGDDPSDKITISNPRKHWDESTGKPVIVLFEGDDSNADLNVYANKVTSKGRDTNIINDMAIEFGRRLERFYAEAKGGLMTPTMILLVVILIAVVAVGFFVIRQPDVIAGLMS